MRIFNTMSRSIEELEPIEENTIGMYTCGPTVYNYAHIGNFRTFIFEDLFKRALEFEGYEVTHVMNVTDVGHLTDDADEGEDKMTVSAREQKKTVWDIAQFYTDAYFRDAEKLNILKPDIVCRATDHIGDMIGLIRKLEDNGCTYQAGGNVYFDISSYPDYGKLALLERQELQAGARIAVDSNKKNPHDFVLWFTNSKFDHQAMMWDSPWGRGYPGWHVECSAMSMKYLGETFDIHCGGIDHIPVHHTNEIAQSEAATGKKWVNYWVHSEFLIMKTGKMSKSSGSFITVEDLAAMGCDPEDYRYLCLGAHYRSQLQFSEDSLRTARASRLNLVSRVRELKKESGGSAEGGLSPASQVYIDQFARFLADDLNIPRALTQVWAILKDDSVKPEEQLNAVYRMDRVLGLGLEAVDAGSGELPPELMELIREREKVRADGNYARADEIRDLLLEQNVRVKDTPAGTEWETI